MKESLFSFFIIIFISACTSSPEPNFIYYKYPDPTVCSLIVGLSQEGNQHVYQVTTDSRTIRGNFLKEDQQIIFSELFASKSPSGSKIKVSALLRGDTLLFQNYGNSMMILPSNSGHLKNVIRYDEVNHGKIDDINEEKILYPLLRCLPARSASTC